MHLNYQEKKKEKSSNRWHFKRNQFTPSMKLVIIHPLNDAPYITLKQITQLTVDSMFKGLNLKLNASIVEATLWQKTVPNQKRLVETHSQI